MTERELTEHATDSELSTIIDGVADVDAAEHVSQCPTCTARRTLMAGMRETESITPLNTNDRDAMIKSAVSAFDQSHGSKHWWQSTRGLAVAAVVLALIAVPTVLATQSNWLKNSGSGSRPNKVMVSTDASGKTTNNATSTVPATQSLSDVLSTLSSKQQATKASPNQSAANQSSSPTAASDQAGTPCEKAAQAVASKSSWKIVTEAAVPWTVGNTPTTGEAFGFGKAANSKIVAIAVFKQDTCTLLGFQTFPNP